MDVNNKKPLHKRGNLSPQSRVVILTEMQLKALSSGTLWKKRDRIMVICVSEITNSIKVRRIDKGCVLRISKSRCDLWESLVLYS